jgi:hypothetical protein
MAVSGDSSLLIRGAHPLCYEDRSRESLAWLVQLLDVSILMEFTRGDSCAPRHGQRPSAAMRVMGPKLHVLQEEGVGGNTMPTRRVEVSGVTAPLELRKTLGRLPAEMKVPTHE